MIIINKKYFRIIKMFSTDLNEEVLTIRTEHFLNKDAWKDRYMIFKSNTQAFKRAKQQSN